ncbi:MAG: TetR/AcrR family transcriptional regulator, partial [Pseudanabaenaceae cyanobacterium bins.68]|nr:TetR/AcrR family transcriptional regulator [Pseudanabaenaceae cyanobacterium bins.68]
ILQPMESVKSARSLSPEKTAAILDGAMQIFLAEGYAGTTMDRIAAVAGVSKPTIYNHFQDKEHLFNSLMEKLAKEKEWSKCLVLLESPCESAPVVLRGIANEMLNSCKEPSTMNTFYRLVVGESGRFPELGKACVRHLDKPMIDALTKYFSFLKLPDPEVTARIFMGTLVLYIISNEVMHGQEIMPMDCDRLVESLIKIILQDSYSCST